MPTPPPLPTPLQFLTSLLSTSPFHSPSSPPSSPQSLLPLNPATKPLLLTLHCLFPAELLPALDLLDRRLVTRFVFDPFAPSTATQLSTEAAEVQRGRDSAAVYYVRSSHQPRRAQDGARTSYEVRTIAWNCTCPAFTFAAFGYEAGSYDGDGEDGVNALWERDIGEEVRNKGKLGGLLMGNEMPVCKHLLACILVERCTSLEEYLEKRVVGREEMAAWAAGWEG